MLTAPAVTAPASVNAIEGGAIGFFGGDAISASDTNGAAEQFSIAAPHGSLAFGSTTGLTVTGNGTGIVVVSGTLSAINSALTTLVYTPADSYTGTDTIGMYFYNVYSGFGADAAISVNVAANHTPPALVAPVSITATQGGNIGFLNGNAIGINDTSGATAQYSIVAEHGTLTFGSTSGLWISGNGQGTVILSGYASAVNAALATLIYTPTAGYSGSDTIGMYTLNPGDGLADDAAIAVTVSANSVPPAITAPTTASVNKGTTLSFTAGNAISMTDTSGATETLSLVAQNGTIAFGSTTGLTISGNGSSTIFLSGSLSAVNSALATLFYTPKSGYAGADTITMYGLNPGDGLSTSAAIHLTVVTPASPPAITAPASVNFGQDGAHAFTGTNAITVADASGTTEQLTLSVLRGNLVLGSTTGLTVTGNGTGTVVVSGSLSSLNTALTSLSYTSTSNTNGTDTLTMSVTDTTTNLTSSTKTVSIIDQAAVIKSYLTANGLTSTITASGLNIVTLTPGNGTLPTTGKTVKVNYSGYLMNSNGTKGTEFDSNIDSAFGHVTPISFKLGAGQVISGWDEAFAQLPVGTTAEIILPSALGYGLNGQGRIPPNAILIFDVTVISVS